MKLSTKFFLGAMIAIVFAGCSTRNTDNLQSELRETSKAYKNGQQNSGQPAPLTSADFYYDDPACVGEPHLFTLNNEVDDNLQVKIWDADLDDWVTIYQEAKAENAPTTFYYTFDNPETYELEAKIGSGGFTGGFFITAENCGCDETFTYVDNGDNTYTFTYIPEEDIEDAELVFTFAQGVAVSGLEDWSVNGVTRQKTMDLNACEVYTWTVGLTANCSGHSPQSNVWTDFKVNGVSKKANPEDKFIQSCE